MFKHSLKTLSAGTVLALAASGVWAQTANTATTPSTTIGVTPQDAKEATQKAVPRADTGTLVRTEPSAADRASDMAKDAKDAATPNTRSNTPTAAPLGTTINRTATGNANPSEPRNSNTTTGTVNNTTTPSQAMGISGTLPGSAPTSGDATNTRNNPGTRATSAPMGSAMDNNHMDSDGTRANNANTNRTNRPARADRN